jgi:succinate dehydrogenase / fumarate reductase cytochrome b subunit
MPDNVKTTLSGYVQYKAQGQVTFLLHRIGGIGLFIFFVTYILALLNVGFINAIYENWFFQIVILFCALFHAINGLRITIFDLWPRLISYQSQAIRVEWAVFLPLYAFAVFVVIRNTLGG